MVVLILAGTLPTKNSELVEERLNPSVLIYLLGQAIFLWVRYTNNYFSSVVRIQTERGHTPCREGPYRYVGHPGYVEYATQTR